MQPYFFPYLGYFDLINCTDHWIVFDTVQYIRHGWVNRNRILHPTAGWQYIIVPLKKHAREALIQEVEIAYQTGWVEKLIGQLQHYRQKAPYFTETLTLIEECLASHEHSISRLNVSILERVCARLGLSFNYTFFSEMNLPLGAVEEPGDWALRIAEALAASEYVNPPGGAELFDESTFKASGIKLNIRHLPPFHYLCRGYQFVPNLSIIDLLMWNTPETIRQYLDKHRTND